MSGRGVLLAGLLALAGFSSAIESGAQACDALWTNPVPLSELDGYVFAMETWDDDGAGPNPPALFIGGTFAHAGGMLVNKIVKWQQVGDEMTWVQLGSHINPGIPSGGGVYAMQVYDSGSGPQLYVAGFFPEVSFGSGTLTVNHIAKWNGTSFSRLGSAIIPAGVSGGAVYALEVFDEDDTGPLLPKLYVGGGFQHAGNLGNVNYISSFDGTNWGRLETGMSAFVEALAVWDDDSSGPNLPGLYAGGGFTSAGSTLARRVAKWSRVGGTMVWAKLPGTGNTDGADNTVLELRVHDEDGSGPNASALFLGGAFTSVGTGVQAKRVARWSRTGSNLLWSAVGTGLGDSGGVMALASYDEDPNDGTPARLYAGGSFSGPPAWTAVWNGTTWSPLDESTNGTVRVLHAFDTPYNPGGPELYAAGEFSQPGNHFARWSCTGQSGPDILIGDLNCNGAVGFDDINPFVAYLSNYGGWQQQFPGCPPENGDINGDGIFPSFGDINPFVALLTGP